MKSNKVIERIYSSYDGVFGEGHIHRKAARFNDAFSLFLEGSADYVMQDGRVVHVKAGDVVYLARGSVYHINVLEWSRWICIDFGFSRTEELDEACVFSDVGIERKNDFQRFLLHWMSNEENGDPRAFEILYKIYADLLQLQGKRGAPSSNLFSHAVEYIVSRYTDASLSVETIATEVGVSTVHLRRIFAANAGTSPIQYINLVRLEQAKMLLSVSNLSIGEIAAQTGFSDPFYFSKVFKKHLGLSPAAYRKSGSEGQP